ncbi:nicotinamide N-methyltransferase [Bombina bombina]|uniref:nicotinamide N-methyltransferase n=1 Tax=Bombina bombina TaxID=8345 RepID=UPI00235B1E25|nr:nicotinamide N-methyltransferase [Bombina bombina]
MSDFTGGDVYQKEFDPDAYLHQYFEYGKRSMGNEFSNFSLKQFAEIFTSGKVKGKTLIDIGTGPTIYQLISACEAFDEIIVTDYTDKNREAFGKWLEKKPGAHDWSGFIKRVCDLEGNRKIPSEKEGQLRKSIKKVLKCDVHKCNPVDPVIVPQADCLLSVLCLESASQDYDSYCTAIKNITTMLKPGGHLVLAGIIGNNYYKVGDVTFSALHLSEEMIQDALNKAGYHIKSFQLSKKTEESVEDGADFLAYFVIVAHIKAQ